MEFILALFQAFAAAKDFTHVSDWVIERVRKWSVTEATNKIDQHIEKLVKVSETEIRKIAEIELVKKAKQPIPEARREEIIGMMVNLSRNLRHRSAFGSICGSSFRSERLLELLIKDIEPVRHQNEPVALGSPWILKRHLGTGSFGEVWMAVNPDFPIARAYKFFKENSSEWLRREQNNLIAILKRLGPHEHIVEFKDVQTNCPYPYLTLEYLGGGSLEDWLVKDKVTRPNIEPSEIIRQIVSGLSAAHGKSIAHRDIKPANLLLTDGPEIRIKIADFGLSRVAMSVLKPEEQSQLASLGGVVGTPLYLPPEAQQRGRRSAFQDDIFALGIVWYQLAMGVIERPPYDFAERLRSKNLDTHTISLIERCLAHPDRRFENAMQLETAMTDLLPPPIACPLGVLDVQYLAREYLSSLSSVV